MNRCLAEAAIPTSLKVIKMQSELNTSRAGILRPEDTPLTMSSREISDLTGKRHLHVLRDIRRMLGKLGGDETKFGSIYLDDMNRDQQQFSLPKRECLILVSGYSVELRAKIIDRWLELEATATLPQFVGAASHLAIDLADRARADNEGIRDLVIHEGGNTRGAIIKTIREIAGNPLVSLKTYLDDRFMASRERDKMVITGQVELGRQQISLNQSVGKLMELAANAFDIGTFISADWVVVSGVYVIAGIPAHVQGKRALSARIAASLTAYSFEADRQMEVRSPLWDRHQRLYRANLVRAWLKDRGRTLIDQHLAKHSGQTVIQFPGKPGEGGAL